MHDESLRKHLREAQPALDNLAIPLWWKDLNHQYAGVNKACIDIFKLKNKRNMLELNDFSMPWRCYAESFIEEDKKIITSGEKLTFLEPIVLGNNERLYILTQKIPYFDSNCQCIGVTGKVAILPSDIQNKAQWHTSLANQLASDNGSINLNKLFVGPSYKRYGLSDRESECLYYTIRGKTAKEIGRLLKLSHRTVEAYLETIKSKLDVSSKRELIQKVIDDNYLNVIPKSIFKRT